jgi:hypothetical protein
MEVYYSPHKGIFACLGMTTTNFCRPQLQTEYTKRDSTMLGNKKLNPFLSLINISSVICTEKLLKYK